MFLRIIPNKKGVERMRIQSGPTERYTTVSNLFLDEYMPGANGDYVKVYLHLLRCIQAGQQELSIASISDCFDYTEGDVIRALRYWEREGLLVLTRDSKDRISDLALAVPVSKKENTVSASASQTAYSTASAPPATEPAPTPSADARPSRREYTAAELHKLRQNHDYDAMIKVIPSFLGRPLNPKDLQTATFIFDDLHFSLELIYHLYEYCSKHGKCRPEFIEAVARNWADAHISTPSDAEDFSAKYNSAYVTVKKAFGMTDFPAPAQREFIDRWITEFAFDDAILQEACRRTILKTGKPNFEYANKILATWYQQKVHTLSDIQRLDQQHKATESNKAAERNNNRQTDRAGDADGRNSGQTYVPNTSNRFNQYSQRAYTKQDYENLERRLLERNYKS